MRRQYGFTYMMMLAAVVILAIASQGAVTFVSHVSQRAGERELMYRGQAYIDAIASYHDAGRTVKTFPRRLQDLVRDPRYLHKRHIRRLYRDPLTHGQWRLLRDEAGFIRGVASRSEREPIKQARFPAHLSEFGGADKYSQWEFVYRPEQEAIQAVDGEEEGQVD